MTSKATQRNRFAAIQTSLGEDVLLLRNFSMQEHLSEVFHIDLDLLSENGSISFESIMGQPASIRLSLAGNEKRYFHGIVSRFSQTGSSGSYSAYRATLIPSYWLLKLSSHCRIFRDESVQDILKKVLSEHQVEFEEQLHRTYSKVEFCVQYRETDFNFCNRLMEQEGIYYYFKHEQNKHTMVLADSTDSHEPFSGYATIDYRPHIDEVQGGEFIWDWNVRHSLVSNRYAHTDFDFSKPKNKLLQAHQTSRYQSSRTMEIYDYPGGYSDASTGEQLAKIRMDEIATQRELKSGTSSARGIAAGYRFRLGSCPGVAFPRAEDFKDYLVVSAQHSIHLSDYESEGDFVQRPYRCMFTVAPQDKQFRPLRTTPKPCVQGIQTAIVVGPQGNEIYTDKYGRVRVQFHWDLDGKNDENSSCWIRVAQNWAGRNWGTIITPRVGQEVIVEFLEGDPDCPIVTGCVYNGDAMPPYSLPSKEAISGIKTNSTKGGQGYNEWSMDDTKGSEKIVLHGQRDMEAKIENDRTTTIVHNDKLSVTTGDQTTKVEAGKSVLEAMQSIELKVGQNVIKIDQTGITIGGLVIKLTGQAQTEIKSPMTNLTGTAVLKIQGGLTTIN